MTALPHLNAEARRFIRDTYYDSEVAAMVRNPDRIYGIVYGAGASGSHDPVTALSHLEGDLADLKSEQAEKERARAALLVLIG